MARLPRLYAPGLPQYVAQRAASGRRLFSDSDDFRLFLSLLGDAVRERHVALHAYVLLPEAVSLLATPPDSSALPAVMQAIGRRFVPFINAKTAVDGPLWDRRYRSTLVDPDGFVLPALVHIEQAPVRAGLVEEPSQWPWSSYRHHGGIEQHAAIADHAAYWALSNTPFERQALYREAAAARQPPNVDERIARAVDRGWALGDERFATSLVASANRRAAPLSRGRRSVPI